MGVKSLGFDEKELHRRNRSRRVAPPKTVQPAHSLAQEKCHLGAGIIKTREPDEMLET
jgi:hypothetical protein